MKRLIVTAAIVIMAAVAAPKPAAAHVDFSIGIGLPFFGTVVTSPYAVPEPMYVPPPVIYSPRVIYSPPVMYSPPAYYSYPSYYQGGYYRYYDRPHRGRGPKHHWRH